MSAVVRNFEGVILDYGDPGARRPYHIEQKRQPSDAQRIAVVAAEGELLTLEVIAEHLDLSYIGMTRFLDALDTIRRALRLKRPALGLQSGTT